MHAKPAICTGCAGSRRRSKPRTTRMNDAPQGIVDRAAREFAVASKGSVLVQAPAGSGKTTLLVSRYLRLLAAVDAPERILALTFTRLAAQEMRQRVLDALGSARRAECPEGMN